MAAIMKFYRIKYENSDEVFDKKEDKKEKDP